MRLYTFSYYSLRIHSKGIALRNGEYHLFHRSCLTQDIYQRSFSSGHLHRNPEGTAAYKACLSCVDQSRSCKGKLPHKFDL